MVANSPLKNCGWLAAASRFFVVDSWATDLVLTHIFWVSSPLVPEGHTTIAQRFIAGSETGDQYDSFPSSELLGYDQGVPPGRKKVGKHKATDPGYSFLQRTAKVPKSTSQPDDGGPRLRDNYQ